MLAKMQEVVEYLRENYEACAELCGKDDDVNTMPAKEAYKKALRIYTNMQEKIRSI